MLFFSLQTDLFSREIRTTTVVNFSVYHKDTCSYALASNNFPDFSTMGFLKKKSRYQKDLISNNNCTAIMNRYLMFIKVMLLRQTIETRFFCVLLTDYA